MGADSRAAAKKLILDGGVHWRHLANTLSRFVWRRRRRQRGLSPQLPYQRVAVTSSGRSVLYNTINTIRYNTIKALSPYSHTIIIGIPSRTHSFTLGLNPYFSANPLYRSLSFFFFRMHYMDFPDCFCYFWAYPSLYFLVFFLFLHFFSCRFRAVD